MRFVLPSLLLLLAPLLTILWRYLRAGRAVTGIRTAILAGLVLAAAGFSLLRRERGSDLLVIADRSLSISQAARREEEEILRALARRRGAGDRLGAVAFGRGAQLVARPLETGEPSLEGAAVDPEASDLAKGIELALGAIPPGRRARLLVLSDGLHTGPAPIAAAPEALRRRIPIDVRVLGRPPGADAAIEDILLPAQVPVGTPFLVKVSIFSEKEAPARIRLARGSSAVSEKEVALRRGLNQVAFRDLPAAPGIAEYRAELEVEGDPVPENNRAVGAVEVVGPKRLLIVNSAGRAGNLARSLSASSFDVEVRGPDGLPASLVELVRYRAAILENVPATRLPAGALAKLASFVVDLGGGLLLTGGRSSFGVGGYYRSPLDPILPVSMELKREHRTLSVAMAIALDRSGSMAIEVGSGLVKMDLANMGTCAAIELLGPGDQVAVVAVDSAAHAVVPLTEIEDRAAIVRRVRGIESMGGGIMTDVALRVAGEILAGADRSTRHLVLFADAADAEETEPGACAKLIDPLLRIGATVSVIGLGKESDSDAPLLRMIAERTGGRIYFTDRPEDLPQVFALETITVSRAGFVEGRAEAEILPEIRLLGEPYPSSPRPAVGGYNMTYLKPGASSGAVADDEHRGPILAFWSRGLGRVAALTAPVDGDHSGELLGWPRYGDFFASLARYLEGEGASGIFADAKRQGEEGVVTVEVDPEDRATWEKIRGAELTIAGGDRARKLVLAEREPGIFEARFPLTESGVYFGSLRLADGSIASVPPVSLPYSPEHAVERDPASGRCALLELARVTGGEERLTWDGAFEGGGGERGTFPAIGPVLAAVLLLHLAEVAARRLGFGFLLRALGAARVASSLALGALSAGRAALARILRPTGRRPAAPAEAPARAPAPAAPGAPEPPRPEPKPSAFEEAKARAQRRLGGKRT